ncbi:hypothetical protein DENSPDRAFT_803824 [Dentipellis sp. KUC8613]|nr:hypothetical protein DENSPDRAFT_803824 [Dentipellis sp. KUC8613]
MLIRPDTDPISHPLPACPDNPDFHSSMALELTVVYLALVLFLAIPSALGHGFIHHVLVNGQAYPGWNPFVDPYNSPPPARVIRKIPSDGPVADVSASDIACNTGGQSGTSQIANANAGSQVTFQWDYWPADHLGPVSTYMTSCNGDCSSFDASNAQWFKINAEGYDNGQFASAKLIANNDTWTSTIPAALADGQYLMRHEIVALHSTGDPQYYPSCTQVNVSGGGSGIPSGQYLVSIPGLYNGVQWPNIYNNFQGLTIPGPPVVQFGGAAAASGPAATSASSTSPGGSSTASTPTPTSSERGSITRSTAAHASTGSPASAKGNLNGQCSLSLARKRSLSRRHAQMHQKAH